MIPSNAHCKPIPCPRIHHWINIVLRSGKGKTENQCGRPQSDFSFLRAGIHEDSRGLYSVSHSLPSRPLTQGLWKAEIQKGSPVTWASERQNWVFWPKSTSHPHLPPRAMEETRSKSGWLSRLSPSTLDSSSYVPTNPRPSTAGSIAGSTSQPGLCGVTRSDSTMCRA